MEKRALCITCVNEKGCIFPKQPLVWQCEEFSDYTPGLGKIKQLKRKEIFCCEELGEHE